MDADVVYCAGCHRLVDADENGQPIEHTRFNQATAWGGLKRIVCREDEGNGEVH